jgi:cyclo(L-tyrosyl-L-tyrosyl) synthase
MIRKILTINPDIKEFEHALIGVSLHNSYFKPFILYELIKSAKRNFKSFHVFLCDTPTVYTFQALGYTKEKSQKKTDRQARWMKNKIREALIMAGIEQTDEYIIDGERLEKNECFKLIYNYYKFLFKNNSYFREICIKTSQKCYDETLSEFGGKSHKQFNVEEAAKYIVWELSLITQSAEILNVGSSLFCYHKELYFAEHIFKFYRQFSHLTSERNGFGLENEIGAPRK